MHPVEVVESRQFVEWLTGLRDIAAKRRILERIARIQRGLMGDAKALGEGLHEFRIDQGPGYRVYWCYRGRSVVLLLSGGDKASQARDIVRARKMMEQE